MSVAEFEALTGLSRSEAENYIEMAGGDVSAAVTLFFDLTSGGGGIPQSHGIATSPTNSFNPPDWYGMVWPDLSAPIPPAWLDQGLAFSEKEDQTFGIPQPKNGPCGVLAAFNAEVLVCSLNQRKSGLNSVPTRDDTLLARALVSILLRVREGEEAPCHVVHWVGEVGLEVKVVEVGVHQVEQYILEHVTQFKGRGGAVLLLYAVVLTRGVDQVKKDVLNDGGQLPLVVGPNWLCTSDLVSLFLSGRAKGNIGAYSPLSGQKISWPPQDVGLLSFAEIEAGIPICDELKSPKYPIFLLHGGDHFTILYSLQEIPTTPGSNFTVYHWNGLPPAGPRLCPLQITAPKGPAQPAPPQHKENFYKCEPGEIEGVIQAHNDDKHAYPKQWTKWRYEVVLAFDDPDVSGVPRPPDVPPEPKFFQGPITPGPWRCTSCYAKRYQTMYFGLNPDGATHCTNCSKEREFSCVDGLYGCIMMNFHQKFKRV